MSRCFSAIATSTPQRTMPIVVGSGTDEPPLIVTDAPLAVAVILDSAEFSNVTFDNDNAVVPPDRAVN